MDKVVKLYFVIVVALLLFFIFFSIKVDSDTNNQKQYLEQNMKIFYWRKQAYFLNLYDKEITSRKDSLNLTYLSNLRDSINLYQNYIEASEKEILK